MKKITFGILFFLASMPLVAVAFPEMIRHGYSQCTACHVSPSGGGVLTPYGREIANELLSTWSVKGESNFLHGALKKDLSEKGVLVGGDVRFVQTHFENANVKRGKFFWMQGNFDVGVQKDSFAGVVSIGELVDPMGDAEFNFNATKYYGLVILSDQVVLRGGRFQPNFGLNMPDHVLPTEGAIGFAPWKKFDSVESSYLGETWTFQATWANEAKGDRERAFSGSLGYLVTEKSKVGASYWRGRSPSSQHEIFGIWAMVGFTDKLFALMELDVKDAEAQGHYGFSRLGYELWRGFNIFYQGQLQQANREDAASKVYAHGIGLDFFPRPHFQFSGLWSRVTLPQGGADSAYLLSHYYF